ncbi:unnamed protein product [Ophioblennius macclurei]
MGIEKSSANGIDVKKMKLILEGHVNDGFKFDSWSSLTGSDYAETPTINDKVHVLIYVVPATSVDMMDERSIEKMKEVRDAASQLDIPQIAVLTKIDEASRKVKKNIRNVYKSRMLEKQMEYLSANIGIPMNCIFPVKNYSRESEMDDDIDTLILNTMRKIIDYGEDFLNDMATRHA